jgi:hypothetical protein
MTKKPTPRKPTKKSVKGPKPRVDSQGFSPAKMIPSVLLQRYPRLVIVRYKSVVSMAIRMMTGPDEVDRPRYGVRLVARNGKILMASEPLVRGSAVRTVNELWTHFNIFAELDDSLSEADVNNFRRNLVGSYKLPERFHEPL